MNCTFLFRRLSKQVGVISRSFSETAQSSGEQKIKSLLQSKFSNATAIEVQDVSGGCGAMYAVYVESLDFKGLNTVKQHQMVTKVLKEEIKEMHGIRIQTALPSSNTR